MKSPSEIRFVEETHQYFLGERELPSITKILGKLGLTKSYDGVDPFYAERGKAVHAAIALDLAGDLDEASVSDVIRPFLAAFRAFKAKEGFIAEQVERVVYDEELGYAGTIDWYGEMRGKRWLIDGKCTKKHDKGSDFQLCGQATALGDTPHHMAILELHETGLYDLCEYPVKGSREVWESTMTLWRRKFL